jgi:Tfp pilus assembly protein PilN
MTRPFELLIQTVIAVALIFLSYVAYGFNADRLRFNEQMQSGAVLQEHCRLLRSLGKTGENCF